MAFSYTTTRVTVIGNMRLQLGTFDADSTTTGAIKTGMRNIEFSSLNNKVNEDKGLIDDTTTAGSILLSALTASDTGQWMAIGK